MKSLILIGNLEHPKGAILSQCELLVNKDFYDLVVTATGVAQTQEENVPSVVEEMIVTYYSNHQIQLANFNRMIYVEWGIEVTDDLVKTSESLKQITDIKTEMQLSEAIVELSQ